MNENEQPRAPRFRWGRKATPSVPPRVPAGEAGFAGVGGSADGEPAAVRRTLWWWVTGGLVALLVVVSLFFFGGQIGTWMAGSSEPTPTGPVTPTALATPGVSAWDQLYGGECLQPFSSPWQVDYTVVDCATPHAAQLVYRGTLAGTGASSAFPGEQAIAEQINGLCTRPGVFDVVAANAYPNLQVQASYPVNAEQWDSGANAYYCFVSRADGSAITGSLAGQGPQ